MDMLFVNNMGLCLLEEWTFTLANMRQFPRTDGFEEKLTEHAKQLVSTLEDTYVIQVTLAKTEAEIEVKTFNDNAMAHLQKFADWANRLIESFNIRFAVHSWTGETTYKDEHSERNAE